MESLKGKTFEFKKGLNLIIGPNGIGKTSLLNVMRYLTFCKSTFYTSSAKSDTKIDFNIKDYLIPNVEMKADYRFSFFNLKTLDAKK